MASPFSMHPKSDDTSEEKIQTDMHVKVNLEQVVDVNLVDIRKNEQLQEEKKPTQRPVKKLELSNNNLLETNIIMPPIEIPVLNITSSAAKQVVASTDWAEMIDVSLPVPEFEEKIKNMALSYPFELDNFQKQAILKLEEGHHVFVAAHTSAGKTAVAEYAIAISRRHKTRVIYTSPIKALSNQKYNDFNKMFGEVGLLTGDLQISTSASCLVMTTEILRSMLYCSSDVTRDLEFVIFDEVHYINNVARGYVWEEVLILLPSHVTFVMLSATVPNALEFANWLGQTKKRKVYVVSTPKRPVPLCHYLYTGTGVKSRHDRFLVVDQEEHFRRSGYDAAVAAKEYNQPEKKMSRKQRFCRIMNPAEECLLWKGLIYHLKQEDNLPVVAFTFSRNRCDQNAQNVMLLNLTTPEEKDQIRSFFEKCLQRLKEPDRRLAQVIRLQTILENGIGVHHSGILPLLRDIVEVLFQHGFVKLLFATETFAMGVNMPARTVVFDDIKKFDGSHRRALTPAEYIQMAGRAGRRGLDDTGTVIILCKEEVPALNQLKDMMLGMPQKLTSQFRLTYAMILGLSRSATLSIEGVMQRSFREFNQICQAENNRKKFELAEKEYHDATKTPLGSHLAPLALFYDTAAAYINALSEVMPILVNTEELGKQFVSGRILVVSVAPYMNQLGVLLTLDGRNQNPYKVLILDAKIQDNTKYNFEKDENWYRMLSFSAMYDSIDMEPPIDTEWTQVRRKKSKYGCHRAVAPVATSQDTEECTTEHTILCISSKNILEVTNIMFKIEHKSIIEDWERRQMPRFKDAPISYSCLCAVRELSRLSHAVSSGAFSLKHASLIQSLPITNSVELSALNKINKYKNELREHRKGTDKANFKTEFAVVYERKKKEQILNEYKQLLSFENLALYPDYKGRLMVLRELCYIDKHDSVILKGHVACGIGGVNAFIITELVFRNVFKDKTPAEIAALLSSFVFETNTRMDHRLTESLEEGVKAIQEIHAELTALETKYLVKHFDCKSERLNFGLVFVVHAWALEKPFAEIMILTDVQEGIIVKCMQQLYELLLSVEKAAMALGNSELQAKMVEASTAIKRDIVFAESLYTTEEETINLLKVNDQHKSRRRRNRQRKGGFDSIESVTPFASTARRSVFPPKPYK